MTIIKNKTSKFIIFQAVKLNVCIKIQHFNHLKAHKFAGLTYLVSWA